MYCAVTSGYLKPSLVAKICIEGNYVLGDLRGRQRKRKACVSIVYMK